MKKENGITLIALIITIIILVILAAVSINAVANMGIVGQAVNGSQEYSAKAVEENKMMDSTVLLIDRTIKNIKKITIEDLTGTTWKLNDKITYPEDIEYNLIGTISNDTYSYPFDMKIGTLEVAGFYSLSWWYSLESHPYGQNEFIAYAPENNLGFPEGFLWGNWDAIMNNGDISTVTCEQTQAPLMTITGGEDVTDPDLISWLIDNATMIE